MHGGEKVDTRGPTLTKKLAVALLVKDASDYTFNLDSIRLDDCRYPDQTRKGKRRCNPLGRNPSDVWEIPRVTGGRGRSSPERSGHPAQMPLELARRVISASSLPGQVALDPFAGSGTPVSLRDNLDGGSSVSSANVATATWR